MFIKEKKLVNHPDDRETALEYDEYAIGIYRIKEDGYEELIGHVPVAIPCLLYHFLRADDGNYIEVEILGKRKREVGLVVVTKYNAFTTNKLLGPTFVQSFMVKALPSGQLFTK